MRERQERHLYRSRLPSLRLPLAATLAIGSDLMTQKAAAAVVNAEAQSKTFPPLDPDTFGPQLVWFALTFGLLFLLVQRVILPRIDEVMKGRRDRISADENRAEELKGDTQSALADHERAIAEAAAITDSMRQKLLRELDRERSRHEAEIAARLVEADKRIAASKVKAIAAVQDVAPDIANAVVARLTGIIVTEADLRRALPSAAE
jgi:F-type H+-transporting ATPase subunit b